MHSMKIAIMTDCEGVAGVINSTDWIHPDSKYYEQTKVLLTEEVKELTPWVHTVEVKYGICRDNGANCDTEQYTRHNWGAVHVHPEVARESCGYRLHGHWRKRPYRL